MLDLFDYCWFEDEIFKKYPHLPNSEKNPDENPETSNPSLPTVSSAESSIEELVSSSSYSSGYPLSPSSVLLTNKLQTIFSGNEMRAASQIEEEEEENPASTREEEETTKTVIGEDRKQRRRRKEEKRKKEMMLNMKMRGLSKSLSDLEFEEIKGFTDLGFSFSEEDRNSSFLTSILPGLQRLGGKEEEEEQQQQEEDLKGRKGKRRSRSVDRRGISKPYLSEVWEVSASSERRRKKENKPLMMRREELPYVNSEIEMKDYLRCWAHSVASSVK